MSTLIDDLNVIALNVDVIMAQTTPAALAAKQATRTLPIVFAAAADPVGSGLVATLARPGGNVTGLTNLSAELGGKRLEQLKQVVPGVSRVAILYQPGAFVERTEKEMLKATDVAARALGVRLQVVEARGPADFDRAFPVLLRGTTMFGIVMKSSVVGLVEQILPLMARVRELQHT